MQTEHSTDRAQDTSPKIVGIAMWILSVAFALGGIILLPGVGGVIVLVGALLVCPARLLRRIPPFKQLFGIVGDGAMEKIVRIVIADALVLGGFALTPWRGGNTFGSFVDLQLATVSVLSRPEYSKEAVDVDDVFSCSSKYVELSLPDDTLASEVGRRVAILQLDEGPYTKEQQKEVVVDDTRPPVIKLKKKRVQVSLGEDFNVNDYIKSVADPVDGELAQVASEPKAASKKVGTQQVYGAGWYIVTPKANTKKSGVQELTIIACDQHGNKATATLVVIVDDPLADVTLKAKVSKFEYAKDKVDATQYVTCSDPKVKVSTDERLDLSSVGKKTIVFTLRKGNSTKNESVTFTVRDTKKPTISLRGEKVTVEAGAPYDVFENVRSAKDEVDGELRPVDVEPSENGNGWFTIVGSYDTTRVGTYDLKVVACDRNGNRVTKSFVFEVEEPPAEEASAEEAPQDSVTTVTTTGPSQTIEIVETPTSENPDIVVVD